MISSSFLSLKKFVGNQTADKKKPNQPLPIHQLPLPWLQLWFVANLQRYRGCGEEPQPVQSLPVSALGASGTRCHSSASVCSVSLGPAVAVKCSSVQEIWPQPPQTAAQCLLTTSLSLELAHSMSPCWFHKLLHHNPTAWPGSSPGFSRPGGVFPTQTLPEALEILLPCLGKAELAKGLHLSFSPLSTPLTLRSLRHLNQSIGSTELWEWAVSSYHTNGSLNQILKPREGRKQWVELEASVSMEENESKITIHSLPLFYYLIASKHRISYLMTLNNLRNHFLSMSELI